MKPQPILKPGVREQWLIDTAEDIESLSLSDKQELHWKDPLHWMLQQSQLLRQGNLDKIDPSEIASFLVRQSDEVFRTWRGHCREVLTMLLLLGYAPAADRNTRAHWKHSLHYHRVRMSAMLDKNPSLKDFIEAMISFAWEGARAGAAVIIIDGRYIDERVRAEVLKRHRRKGKWRKPLPLDCPWKNIEVLGYDARDSKDHLADPRRLPFEESEPFDSSRYR